MTLWTIDHQAPLSMGFLKQEYWRGLPFLYPGDFPDPGIEPASPALASKFFTTEPLGKPISNYIPQLKKKKEKKRKVTVGFSNSSVGKESSCNAGGASSIPESGRSAEEEIGHPLQYSWASLVAQLVKNLPAVQKTWVPSLGWEDSLEIGKATHSSILAWRIPWGHKKLNTNEQYSHSYTVDSSSCKGSTCLPNNLI